MLQLGHWFLVNPMNTPGVDSGKRKSELRGLFDIIAPQENNLL
jgi:hypothetical protein